MRVKKSWLPLFFIMVILLPKAAYSLERDPYMRRTLAGRVYLEYEKNDIRQGTYSDITDRFQQTYNLDMKGNIYARNAMIYSLGGSFSNSDETRNGTKNNYKVTEYNFDTTLLPMSAIPLTLFGTHSESRSTIHAGNSTTDTYGLDWLARIRSLPETKVHAEKRDRVSEQMETVDTIYRVKMKKEIGPSKNELELDSNTTDNASSGRRNSQNTLNFTNDTEISRSTLLHAGATQNITVNQEGQKNTMQGLSIDLSSKPSTEFTQKHRYTFYSNATNTSNQQGHNYDGSMSYAFSRVTLLSAAAALQKNTNNTPSSQLDTENINANAALATALTKHIGFSQSFSYSEYKTNIVAGVGEGNMTGRTTFTSNTSLSYNRQFRLALFSSYYGLSYTKDQTNDPKYRGGSMLGQNAGVTFSNINFNRFIGFNAGASYSDTQAMYGSKIHENTRSYNAGAFNKSWKKYFGSTATYRYSLAKSWLSILDKETEAFSYHIDSNYITNTKAAFSFNDEKTYSLSTGATHSTSKTATLSHNRSLLGGNFGANGTYSTSDNTYRGGFTGLTTKSISLNYARAILRGNFSFNGYYSNTDYTFQTGGYTAKDRRYTANYIKALFRRVAWRMTGERTETERTDANIFTHKSSIENALAYRLRAWTLSAEHKYTLTKNESYIDMTENRFLLRAERVFGMFL